MEQGVIGFVRSFALLNRGKDFVRMAGMWVGHLNTVILAHVTLTVGMAYLRGLFVAEYNN